MRRTPARRRTATEAAQGYAVLMALFLVASLMLIVTAATPSLLLQGRREREDEAVWRGKQYVRAIHLYFQKNGRFPASLEDLTKPGPANVHFLRKVYTDPMNRADGSWRAIYMAPSGQLTGSVRYHSLQEMAAQHGVAIPAAGVLPAGAAGTAPQGSAQPLGAQQTAAQPGTTGAPQGQGAGGLSAMSSSTASPATAVPLQAVDGPVMGALVIGVGSKVKEPSIRVYEGGETYAKWEFIWNPLLNGAGQLPGATTPATGTTPAAGQSTTGQPATGQPANTTTPANSPGGLSKQ